MDDLTPADAELQHKFEKIFVENFKRLFTLAYNFTGDSDGAKDLVQDVFFKLWKRRSEIRFGPEIVHYLYQATTHASYNFLKGRGTRLKILSEITRLAGSKSKEETDPVMISELEMKAWQAIDRLPPKCKVIFLLSRNEQMKYREIAEHLHISVKTVENQMGIALEKLRTELRPFLTREFLVPLLAILISFLVSKIIFLIS